MSLSSTEICDAGILATGYTGIYGYIIVVTGGSNDIVLQGALSLKLRHCVPDPSEVGLEAYR
jgi:hypothetical protein